MERRRTNERRRFVSSDSGTRIAKKTNKDPYGKHFQAVYDFADSWQKKKVVIFGGLVTDRYLLSAVRRFVQLFRKSLRVDYNSWYFFSHISANTRSVYL